MLPDYKEIAELLKKGLTLEAQEKIMSLREGALVLQEENLNLRERVKQLEMELSLARNLVFKENGYWLSKSDGSCDGPFCSVCYDDKQKLVRLHAGRNYGGHARLICLACKNRYA